VHAASLGLRVPAKQTLVAAPQNPTKLKGATQERENDSRFYLLNALKRMATKPPPENSGCNIRCNMGLHLCADFCDFMQKRRSRQSPKKCGLSSVA